MKNNIELRDWFAGMAISSIDFNKAGTTYALAKLAYEIADEMMKRRERESIRVRQQGIADGNKK